MQPPLSYVPAMPAAIGICAGILLHESDMMWIGVYASSLMFLILILLHKQYLSYFPVFVICGILVSIVHEPQSPKPYIFDDTHNAEGEIMCCIEQHQSSAYIIEIGNVDDKDTSPFKAYLISKSVENMAEEGSRVKFKAIFSPISQTSDVPHESDYHRYLKAEGIVCTAFAIGPVSIISEPDEFSATVNKLRKRIYNAIVDSPVSAATSSFLVAAIIGDRTMLTEADTLKYRSTGIAHILALSGLHVGIIASMASLLLIPLNLIPRHRYIRRICVIFFVWIYAFLVGMQPSIIRAAVMLTVFIVSGHLQRGYFAFNSLFISIIIILLVNPQWLFTPGFQLSVSAVASILMFGCMVPLKLKRRPLLYYTLNLFIISIAAMLGTGIVSAYYFNMLPSMFLFGNIIAGVLFPLILGAGVILAVSTMCGVKLTVIGYLTDKIFHVMDWAIEALSKADYGFTCIYFSPWVMIPYAIALIYLAFAIRQHKRYQWIMCAGMLMLCVIVDACDTEDIPVAELYMPRHRNNSQIIMRYGNDARVYVDDNDSSILIADSDKKYRRFLLSRGCGEHFAQAKAGWRNDAFEVWDDHIVAYGKTIKLMSSDLPGNSSIRKYDYILVSNKYTGHIPQLLQSVKADTVLLGADIHPSRRARMIRECADSIPFRDIRTQGFSLILDCK